MLKVKAYSTNLGTKDSLKVNIDYIMSSILPAEPRCTVNNMFVRYIYIYIYMYFA